MSKGIETVLLPLAWLGKQTYCKGSAMWEEQGNRKSALTQEKNLKMEKLKRQALKNT